MKLCSRNRAGDLDFRSHLSKHCLSKGQLARVQDHITNNIEPDVNLWNYATRQDSWKI